MIKNFFEDIYIDLRQLDEIIDIITTKYNVTGINETIWALKALSLTDLTTLSGDDTKANVYRLCCRAANPFPKYILNELLESKLHNDIHTAAICVYPSRVNDVVSSLNELQMISKISIAAVATGFPTGQYPIETRLKEIEYAINNGATEIDVVINRTLALEEKWEELYNEIVKMRQICSNRAHLKTILAVGELGTMENVYKASMVAMLAGSDFIKTSTGKESVNATLPVGLVMINAIKDFQRYTGRDVGLKPAGGIRTVRDAIAWMTLIKETLGLKWLTLNYFVLEHQVY